MLEEKEEGGGAEERGILAVELRFAEFWRFMGRGLAWWEACDWWREAGHLSERCCWGDC